MTYLQLVNRVLKRLRESQVSAIAETEYSALIGEFINDIKEEMEDAHAWQTMQRTVEFSSVVDQEVYDLTATLSNSGDVANTSNVTNERSQMLYETKDHYLPLSRGRTSLPMLYDVTDEIGFRMRENEKNNVFGLKTLDTTQTQDMPDWFAVSYGVGAVSTVGAHLELYPKITSVRSYKSKWYIPQDYLEEGDGAETVLVPSRVLILGAWYLALNERGEEIGEPGQIAFDRYQVALNDAIDVDIENQNRLNKIEAVQD